MRNNMEMKRSDRSRQGRNWYHRTYLVSGGVLETHIDEIRGLNQPGLTTYTEEEETGKELWKNLEFQGIDLKSKYLTEFKWNWTHNRFLGPNWNKSNAEEGVNQFASFEAMAMAYNKERAAFERRFARTTTGSTASSDIIIPTTLARAHPEQRNNEAVFTGETHPQLQGDYGTSVPKDVNQRQRSDAALPQLAAYSSALAPARAFNNNPDKIEPCFPETSMCTQKTTDISQGAPGHLIPIDVGRESPQQQEVDELTLSNLPDDHLVAQAGNGGVTTSPNLILDGPAEFVWEGNPGRRQGGCETPMHNLVKNLTREGTEPRQSCEATLPIHGNDPSELATEAYLQQQEGNSSILPNLSGCHNSIHTETKPEVSPSSPPRILDITVMEGSDDTAAFIEKNLTEEDWKCCGNAIDITYLKGPSIAKNSKLMFVFGFVKKKLCSICTIKRTGRNLKDVTIPLLWTKGKYRGKGFIKALFHIGLQHYASDVDCILSGNPCIDYYKRFYEGLKFTKSSVDSYCTTRVGPLIQRLQKHMNKMTENGWEISTLRNEKDQDGDIVLVVDLTDIDEAGGPVRYKLAASSETETTEKASPIDAIKTLPVPSKDDLAGRISTGADGDKKNCAPERAADAATTQSHKIDAANETPIRITTLSAANISNANGHHRKRKENHAAKRAPAERGENSVGPVSTDSDKENSHAAKRVRFSLPTNVFKL